MFFLKQRILATTAAAGLGLGACLTQVGCGGSEANDAQCEDRQNAVITTLNNSKNLPDETKKDVVRPALDSMCQEMEKAQCKPQYMTICNDIKKGNLTL